MKPPSHLMAACIHIGIQAICMFMSCGTAPAADVAESHPPLYDADPQHLWNRLHESLLVRVGPDGKAYGRDRLEPLLWAQSEHLLERRSNKRAVGVLTEFLDIDGERLVDDPLKRALLQRDLWMVFNWLEGKHRDFEKPSLDTETVRAAKQRLRDPLAAVIRRLALAPKQMEKLPDNYGAAVTSTTFASRFDSENADESYLPPDLFDPTGPWVCVGRSDGVTAPQHLRPENPFTNSVFLVFVRLPTNRVATSNYLKQLISFEQPLLIRNKDGNDRGFPFVPNPRLAQFPKGTQLALVRRAMLIDSTQQVVASPLTENVQLRIIHDDVPLLTRQVRYDAYSSTAEGMRRVGAWQSFQEFQLSRTRLLAGRAGGLRAIKSADRDFKTGFNAHLWDEFELPLSADRSFPNRSQRFTNREQCFSCHSLPGVYSFNSFADFRSAMRRREGDKVRPFPLAEMAVSQVEKSAIEWKQGQPNWLTLHKLLTNGSLK